MSGLRLEGLTKRFDDVVALDNVSLDIQEGELFFLLGPSGCGKTTLLRTIAGFTEPDSGRVYHRGVNLLSKPIERRGIGMVFQSYSLWPHMSVFDNVAYGLRIRKVERPEIERRVHRCLDMVALKGLAHRKPGELSGGQQQRVALARAIVYEPELLLLDEPLSNLDAKLRKEMRREIRRLHQQLRITMVYVTHDQEEAASMAHRIALMRHGRVVQVGTPRELYCQPRSVYAAEVFGRANVLHGRLLEMSDTDLKVAIGDVTLRVSRRPGSGELSREQNVNVIVRPEEINVVEHGQGALSGQVVEREFNGAVETYTIELESGTRVVALTLHNPANVLEPGAAVAIDIHPHAAHVVPETEEP